VKTIVAIIVVALSATIAIVSLMKSSQPASQSAATIPKVPNHPLSHEQTALWAREWRTVEDLPQPLAQFDTVFWEPADTTSLRQLIRETDLVRGKRVLEIGTGTGLVALCCLHAGAERVVATDINPAAIENARFNARQLKLDDRLDVRRVTVESPQAFAVIGDDERFDLIISNPPWENDRPKDFAEFALYDESFLLLRSLLSGLQDHLRPGGKALLAYGCVNAIRTIQKLAPEHGLSVRVLDDRNLDDLPDVFLPGMLLEVTPHTTPAADVRSPTSDR
jgi:release factor glutamine methyltransferase